MTSNTTEFAIKLPGFVCGTSESFTLTTMECRSWCIDQHITRLYENEWLLVAALFFLTVYWLCHSVGPHLSERGPEIALRLKAGCLLAVSILLASYAWLLTISIG